MTPAVTIHACMFVFPGAAGPFSTIANGETLVPVPNELCVYPPPMTVVPVGHVACEEMFELAPSVAVLPVTCWTDIPAGPVGPLGPVGPVAPSLPLVPFVPLVPFAPVGPLGPVWFQFSDVSVDLQFVTALSITRNAPPDFV